MADKTYCFPAEVIAKQVSGFQPYSSFGRHFWYNDNLISYQD